METFLRRPVAESGSSCRAQIVKCADGDMGNDLMFQVKARPWACAPPGTILLAAGSAKVYALVQMMQEAKEAKPPVSSAPWILVDGQHVECPHGECDLLAVVCKRLKDARLVPPACTGKM